jgi:hypothetical protein
LRDVKVARGASSGIRDAEEDAKGEVFDIMQLWHALGAAALSLAAPAIVVGDTIEITGDSLNSTEQLGDDAGSISYDFDAISDIGVLTVSLTNVTDPDDGGSITGPLFNIDSAVASASTSLVSATHRFLQCFGNGLSGQLIGSAFDAGAALGGTLLGSGSPVNEIAGGSTGEFVFNISAADASGNPTESFLNGQLEFDFVVAIPWRQRWRIREDSP